jgi:hypothetical protein
VSGRWTHLGVPPAADFPDPLGLDQGTRTLTVLRGEDEQSDDKGDDPLVGGTDPRREVRA